MKRAIVSFVLIVLFSVSVFSIVWAQSTTDWWPMFHHDPTHAGYSTSTAPNTNQTQWKYRTGSYISYSSPAVVDGKVYVGSCDNNVYCLGASNGGLTWKYTTGGTVDSSPAVADGKVYVGSDDKNVYCLDASDGAFIWKYTTGKYVLSSPAVADGKVYVGSYNNNVYCFGPSPSTTLSVSYLLILSVVAIAIAAIVPAAFFISRRKTRSQKQQSNSSEANAQPKDGDGKPSTG
jgi:hypothetical protein